MPGLCDSSSDEEGCQDRESSEDESSDDEDIVFCAPARRRNFTVRFGDTEYKEIPAVPEAWKKPNTSHDENYKHPPRIHDMIIREEEQKARIQAEVLHHEVLLNLDKMPIMSEPVVGRRRSILKSLRKRLRRHHQ